MTSVWNSSMSKLKVAVIVGSNRRVSIRRLAEALVRLVGDRVEPHFVRIDDLPMYNQDLEGNRPETVARFTQEVAAADALLFVTPEHNRAVPAVLKNAIDWGSKPMDRNVWKGRVVAACISFKPDLIDEFGEIANEGTQAFLQAYMDAFLALAAKLAAELPLTPGARA
jgi:chromate reductase, NAD(P)H dehydrogenase (quinone)